MHLRERPLTQKVGFGDEPIANTIWGLNTSWYTPSNFITTLIDKLPLVETKTPSSVSFEAEFAHLVPGHPSVRSEEHTSELQSRPHLVCRLLLEKKKKTKNNARLLIV